MFTGRIWRNIAPALAVGLGLIASDVAQAGPGSAACRSIESQLARGGASSNRKYSAAAERQRREIAKVRGQMAAAGCGFFSSNPRCGTLQRMSSKMNANLRTLTSQSGQSSGRSRAQLLAALDANDCRGTRKSVVVASRDNRPGLFERLFGQPTRVARERRRAEDAPVVVRRVEATREKKVAVAGARDRIVRETSNVQSYGGGLRTFCVRTCDGYYFPMSPSSSHDDLARDEQNCQAACPGAETALYYHENDLEDAESMISRIDGKPYEKLKTAFLYRDADTLKSAQCTCQRANTVAFSSAPENSAVSFAPAVPLPANRPDPSTDPETQANAEGDLSADAMRRLFSGDASDEIAARQVRVVGPVFLPDPKEAAARRFQAPTATR